MMGIIKYLFVLLVLDQIISSIDGYRSYNVWFSRKRLSPIGIGGSGAGRGGGMVPPPNINSAFGYSSEDPRQNSDSLIFSAILYSSNKDSERNISSSKLSYDNNLDRYIGRNEIVQSRNDSKATNGSDPSQNERFSYPGWGIVTTPSIYLGRRKEKKSDVSFYAKFEQWWKKISEGRSGLLLVLAPTVISQLRLLQATTPFLASRFMQYMQPLNLCFLTVLSQPKGLQLLRTTLWFGVFFGFVQMLRDSFRTGATWSPATPLSDSYAVITGASTGLGEALAYQLYDLGYNLVLIARNETKLEIIRNDLYSENYEPVERDSFGIQSASNSVGIQLNDKVRLVSQYDNPEYDSFNFAGDSFHHPANARKSIELIPCDLTNPTSSFEILRELKARGLQNKIDMLVLNAGSTHYGELYSSSLSNIRRVMDLNVGSTVNLLRTLLPRIASRKVNTPNAGSRIVIVSSAAAAAPGPNVAIYAASKAFVSSFGHALRRELLSKGVLVTVAEPGPIIGTKFFDEDRGYTFKPTILKFPFLCSTTDEVARQIVEASSMGKDYVCPGIFNKIYVHILSKLLPLSSIATASQVLRGPFPLFQTKHLSSPEQTHRIPTAKRKKPLKERFKQFWYNPVLDYKKIKDWFLGKKVHRPPQLKQRKAADGSEEPRFSMEDSEQQADSYLETQEEEEERKLREFYLKIQENRDKKNSPKKKFSDESVEKDDYDSYSDEEGFGGYSQGEDSEGDVDSEEDLALSDEDFIYN